MSALKMVLSPGMVLSASEVRRLEADWADGDRQCAATNREQDRNPSDRSENSFRARMALQLGATAAAMAIFPEMKLTSLGGPFRGSANSQQERLPSRLPCFSLLPS